MGNSMDYLYPGNKGTSQSISTIVETRPVHPSSTQKEPPSSPVAMEPQLSNVGLPRTKMDSLAADHHHPSDPTTPLQMQRSLNREPLQDSPVAPMSNVPSLGEDLPSTLEDLCLDKYRETRVEGQEPDVQFLDYVLMGGLQDKTDVFVLDSSQVISKPDTLSSLGPAPIKTARPPSSKPLIPAELPVVFDLDHCSILEQPKISSREALILMNLYPPKNTVDTHPRSIFIGKFPYYNLRQVKQREKIECVTEISFESIHDLWRQLKTFSWASPKLHCANEFPQFLADSYRMAVPVTVYIESCSNIKRHSPEVLESCWQLIEPLHLKGACVVFSDVSLAVADSFMKYSGLPSCLDRVVPDVCGFVRWDFCPETFQSLPGGCLSVLTQLNSGALIYAMPKTHRPVLITPGDNQNWQCDIRVLAVAAVGPPQDWVSTDPTTGEWSKYPGKPGDLSGAPAVIRVESDRGPILLLMEPTVPKK